MNSKNLSKAINRMLAILLTAAMVAGSFTVPVKADVDGQTVAEETTAVADDAAETSDDVENAAEDETSGEVQTVPDDTESETPVEESDELEKAVGSSLDAPEIQEEGVEGADGVVAENICIGINTTELAKKIPTTYNATTVAKSDIENYIKVYTDSTKTVELTSATPTITYNVKKSGSKDWIVFASGSYSTGDADLCVGDAGEYRIDVAYTNSTYDVELYDSYSFTIDKVDVSNWTWKASEDGSVTATTSYKYNVASVDPEDDYNNATAAVEMKGSDITKVAYAVPTSGSKLGNAVCTALAAVKYDGTNVGFTAANADFTLTAGEGWNTLSNASVGTVGTDDAKLPKVTVTLKDNVTNFKGQIKNVLFKIGKNIGTLDGTNGPKYNPTENLLEQVYVTADAGAEGYIDLASLFTDSLIKDKDGKSIAMKGADIEDITISDLDSRRDNYIDFFAYEAGISGGSAVLNPIIKLDPAGSGKLYYKTLKLNEINTNGNAPDRKITVKLTVTLKNYSTTQAVDIDFITTKNEASSGVEIVNGDGGKLVDEGVLKTVSVQYTGKPAEFQIKVKDSNSAALDQTAANGYVSVYFYKGLDGDKDKEYLGKGTATRVTDNPTPEADAVNYLLTAPTLDAPAEGVRPDLIEIGKYSALIVYKGADNANAARQTANFEIVKNTTNQTITVSKALTGSKIGADGNLELKSGGTNFTKDDIEVKIGTVVLKYGEEYEILDGNDNADTTKTWTYEAKVKEIVDKYKDTPAKQPSGANTAAKLTNIYNNDDHYYDDEFANEVAVGEFRTSSPQNKIPFKDQPYAKIQIKDGKYFKSSDPVYYRYEITDTVATQSSTFKTEYIVAKDNEGMTIPLTGAYTVDDKVVEPEYYTIASATPTGVSITAQPSGNIAPATGLVYESGKMALTNTIVFVLTPHFAESSMITASDLTITVKCKNSANLVATLDSSKVKDGVHEYDKNAIAGTDITLKITDDDGKELKGNAAITATKTLYRLAAETENKNPNQWDKYEYKGQIYTQDAQPNLNSDGTDKDTQDSHIPSSAVTAVGAGTYLFVIECNDSSYDVEKVELPFVIGKKELSASNISLKILNTTPVTTAVYKDANYTSLTKTNATFSDIIKGVSGSASALLTGTLSDYMTMSVGPLTKDKTTGNYEIAVTMTPKDDNLTKKTPFINNFKGSVVNKVTITQATIITGTDFVINVSQKKLVYTGEVLKPELLNITYKGQPYTGTEAQILSQLQAAIDPDYLELELVWPGDEGNFDTGKTVAGSHTITLKCKDSTMYTFDSDVKKTYNISAAPNTDMVVKDEYEIIAASGNGSTQFTVGMLPMSFASKTGGDTYKVKEYDISAITADVAKSEGSTGASSVKLLKPNSTTPANGMQIDANGVLKIKADNALVSGDIYEFTAKAKFDNYETKDVKVKIVVKDAGLDTTITNITSQTGSIFNSTGSEYNGLNAEERLALYYDTKEVKVTQKGKTVKFTEFNSDSELDGTLKFEWYDDITGKPCALADTVNVGTYYALVTLEDAKQGYYMTPAKTQNLVVTAKTISDDSGLDGDITIESAGFVYDGEAKVPTVTINVKEGVIRAKADKDTTNKIDAITASPATKLVQGKDFKLNYTDGATVPDTTSTVAGTHTATLADGNLTLASAYSSKFNAIASHIYRISKKDLTINLKDATLPLNTKDPKALKYEDVKDTVEGLVEGHKVIDAYVALKATDSTGKAVALADVCKKAGTYTITVDDEFAADTIQNATAVDVTANYKLASASKSATVTVQAPQELAVTAEIKVGDKAVANGKKILKPETAAAVTAVVKDGSGKTIDPADYELTVKNASGAAVASVFALGKYTVTIESTNDAFTFKPEKIEIEFEVVETIPRVVQSVSADPEKVTLNFGKDTMKTATSTISAVFDVADETLAAADIDYSSNKVAGAINVSIADGGVVTFKTTAYGDKEPIVYTFWVDGDETKTATVAVTNKPESSAPSSAEPGTPEDTPDEYEKPEDSTLDINDSGLMITASKEYTYTGKPIQAAVKVAANPNKLVNGVDYKVTYADNISAGKGKILVSGINQYNGLLKDGEIVFTIKPKKASGFTVVAGSISSADEILDSVDDNVVNERISVYDGTRMLAMNDDYTIENIVVGTKKIDFVVKGAGNYDSNTQKKASIAIVDLKGKIDIGTCTVSDIDDQPFTGSAIKPNVMVTGEDGSAASYTVTYKNNKNVGVATVTIKGKGDYAGSIVTTFNIVSPEVEEKDVTITVKDMTYTGKLLKPSVKVQVNVNGKLKTLSKNKDYAVYYGAELNAGKGRVIIRGLGNYEEILTDTEKEFTINQADFKKVSIKKDKSTKRSGVYFNNKKLVANVDFIAGVSGPDAKGKYTVTVQAKPDSKNFTGSAVKTIKGTAAQIDWEQLGFDVDSSGKPIL